MIRKGTHVRSRGQRINITAATVAHMRYVMEALKMQPDELGARLGLCRGSVNHYLRGKPRMSLEIFEVFHPRLVALVERADKGVGEVALVRDPHVHALNPLSSPAAKDFALGPYRKKVEERAALGRSAAHRERHREAMKAYWIKRRAREVMWKKQYQGSLLLPADQVIAPDAATTPTPIGFFRRIFNSIVTGFHA